MNKYIIALCIGIIASPLYAPKLRNKGGGEVSVTKIYANEVGKTVTESAEDAGVIQSGKQIKIPSTNSSGWDLVALVVDGHRTDLLDQFRPGDLHDDALLIIAPDGSIKR